jgi:metallo-beta-lactamase class B
MMNPGDIRRIGMKKIYLCATIFICCFGLGFTQSTYKRIAVSKDIEVIRLSEHAYIHVSYAEAPPWGRVASNGMIVVSNGEALLLDTPMNDALTKTLVEWITGSLKARVVGFLANHWHPDCIGGLAYLHSVGIPSYAHQKIIEICQEKKLPMPQHAFVHSLTLRAGKEVVISKYFGAGHTVDNIVSYIPSERILFGGCMVKDITAETLGNIADADLTEWPKTIGNVRAAYPAVRIVVPGHGAAGGAELLTRTAELLAKQTKLSEAKSDPMKKSNTVSPLSSDRPLPSKNPLAREIAAAKVAPGSLRIWWLGQEGFVIKGSRLIVYIDPYLSDYCERVTRGKPNEHIPITKPPLQPGDVDHADVVLCTHDHADHLDPDGIPVIARSSPRARFVVPRCALKTMLRLGVTRDRILTLAGNDSLSVGDLEVRAIPAMHETFDRDPEKGFPFLSYILTLEGKNLFHAGDTIPYEGQVGRAATQRIDVAFLPINGRDDFRHRLSFRGNFTCAEAVAFARAVQSGLTVPMHYDKFSINTGDVNEFTRLARQSGIPYRVMHVGESFVLPETAK